MFFKDRHDAGKQLAKLLGNVRGQEAIVFGLPRGGVVLAAEIARFLKAPLDVLLAHKIGHPMQPEYAIAAISEGGHLVGNQAELARVGEKWLQVEKQKQVQEIKRKRELYMPGKKIPSLEDKIAILVDDGIATGLTLQAAILELKERVPLKLIVAVPVAPKTTAERIEAMVDEFVALSVPEDWEFLGAVGAYYADFAQVEDEEVIQLLKTQLPK